MKKWLWIIVPVIFLFTPSPVVAAPATRISIEVLGATKPIKVGDTVTVDIIADSGGNTLAAVDLVLKWDTAIFEGIDVASGEFIPNIISPLSKTETGARVSFGVVPTAPARGVGKLGTLTLKAIKENSTSVVVSVDKNTKAAGLGEKGNTVVSFGEASLPAVEKGFSVGIGKEENDKLTPLRPAGPAGISRWVLAIILSVPIAILGVVMLILSRRHEG